MPLDPQVAIALEKLSSKINKPIQEWPLEEAREFYDKGFVERKLESVYEILDFGIRRPSRALPIRIYRPHSHKHLPAIVFYHGGGWALGTVACMDFFCRIIANKIGCIVVSVGYSLAPEHPFPSAVDDSYAALKWVAEHAEEHKIDHKRIAVAGDSAGGNLAAVMSLMARDQKGPEITFQALIYPVMDADFNTSSYLRNDRGYSLDRDTMIWFWDLYAPRPQDRKNPYAAPLQEKNLKDLPPALLMTAEYDPLCDEGEAYALKLSASGVPTICKRYSGLIHGFFLWHGAVDQVSNAVNDFCEILQKVFRIKGDKDLFSDAIK